MLLGVPAVLEANLIFVDVTPGLFVLLCVGGTLLWRRYRLRGLVNGVSDLPNLNALRNFRDGRKQALIAARVINYEEIVANLPANSERQLVDQIVSRLTVGASGRTLYHGDGGIFAWFDTARQPFGNQLEALHSLFRNPARVAGLSIDLSISVRGRSRQRTLARQPAGQRFGRRRGSRARRTQVEISRPRDASRTPRGGCPC